MSEPDPIIVARDEVLAEVAIQMHGLTRAERFTLLDTLGMSLHGMLERMDAEDVGEGWGGGL